MLDTMLTTVFRDVLKKANNLDPKMVEDVCIGNVIGPGAGSVYARAACLQVFPYESTTTCSINRFCGSGLQAVSQIAN